MTVNRKGRPDTWEKKGCGHLANGCFVQRSIVSTYDYNLKKLDEAGAGAFTDLDIC